MALQLFVANKNYSSWSMRPWLLLKQAGIPFIEQTILLGAESGPAIAKVSPSGRVPVLVDGDLRVHDSLAICEYLAEKFPEKNLWPRDSALRALARAWCAEMHAGFTALRSHAPMNVRRFLEKTPAWPEEVRRDIARIEKIWSAARAARPSDGDFLLGDFSILDAYYWPVVSRLLSYRVELAPESRAYAQFVWRLPVVLEWVKFAKEEEASLPHYDAVY